MSGRSVNLTTLFRWPKRLSSTKSRYFSQKLITALLVSAEGETKVTGRTGYLESDTLHGPTVFSSQRQYKRPTYVS